MLIGLIGKTNVGKSTFFNASTDLSVPIGNYPFTTIDPNVGIAYVRSNCVCTEFGVQDNPIHSMCINGNRFIPIKMIDIAGLVPGAYLGRGLGNKFLDDSRQADVLIHVIDSSGSTDLEGRPIDPEKGNPLEEINFVEEEFDKWLFTIVYKDWIKMNREIENMKQKIEDALAKRLSGLSISESNITYALNQCNLKNKKPSTWSEDEILTFCKKLRIISKPVLIAANKADLSSSEYHIKKIQESGRMVIPCASEAEVVLRRASKKGLIYYLPGDGEFEIKNDNNLNDQQKKALDIIKIILDKLKTTGIQDSINKAIFELLKLIVVYPVEDEISLKDKKGNILPNAFLMHNGSTARDLANNIHADLGKGFMFAIDVRTKQRLGSEYKLKHNDVIKIVSATSRS